MNLFGLAGVVCRTFDNSYSSSASQVVMVKDGQSRDVVTRLDMDLHDAVLNYVEQSSVGTGVLSEEGSSRSNNSFWEETDLLVLDPLDGSNNVALGLPGYCFMAAHVLDRRLTSSLVVLPEYDLYLIWQEGKLFASRNISLGSSAASSSTYYAYPPRLGDEDERIRAKIWQAVDQNSSGLYRTGSAGIGLFHLLRGAHKAFVGHRVRVWDVLAYFPILQGAGFEIRYRIDGNTATAVASRDSDFVNEIRKIFGDQCSFWLTEYDQQAPIVTDQQ